MMDLKDKDEKQLFCKRYDSSFVTNNDFRDKRFNRYVNKTKEIICKNMLYLEKINEGYKIQCYDDLVKILLVKIVLNELLIGLYYDEIDDKDEMCLKLLIGCITYLSNMEISLKKKEISLKKKEIEYNSDTNKCNDDGNMCAELSLHSIKETLKKDMVPTFTENNMTNYMKKYAWFNSNCIKKYKRAADHIATSLFEDKLLLEIINDDTKNACEFHIRKISSQKCLDNNNYFLSLPETSVESFDILIDVVNRVLIDIFAEIASEDFKFTVDVHRSNDYRILNQKYQECVKKIGVMELEITQQNLRIRQLLCDNKEKDYENKKIKLNCFDDLRQIELIKENSRLKKEYEKLLEKYENLKKRNEKDDESNLLRIVKDNVKIKYDGVYAFLMYENNLLKKEIIKTFPNAMFIETNQQMYRLDFQNIDCVICMTNNIGHDIYKKIKSKCKIHNVKFLHCSNSNIKIIEQLLSK